ncbi:bis(5'-nucleosyl)-tetraphosphatase (symmetrical) YqeK [Scopulibacillus cellulosilyticus]|uniref:bis(5'-nucleosyl)-tetraphosphatase (symmetrical) n=1 Tax=Scopulibacillus cellulosilyticus TaxID=2665665 RepID=A0ABW2PX71_9BACL
MKIEEADHEVKQILPRKRYEHTLGVVQSAKYLAGIYNGDVKKAELAAMLHDIAKYFSKDDMISIIKKEPDIPDDLLNYHLSLWHAPVGAAYVRETYGVHNSEILNAIYYHTTGRSGMTLLEKIVFLADYIEPGRDFPAVAEVRKLAETDLDTAVAKALENTIIFLISRHQQIYPDTISAYNDLIKRVGRNLK